MRANFAVLAVIFICSNGKKNKQSDNEGDFNLKITQNIYIYTNNNTNIWIVALFYFNKIYMFVCHKDSINNRTNKYIKNFG